ncbi:transketolase C-terminal domain-containing protein [Hyphomicrobium sp.]|uniref:transketolase C-terminal domain-containing protein n=1 Tax=Hyphomicrobium sp. TaxID=82 RepID=UPI002C0667B6|nr:transketolase C-terminal domain-containing protein [Hyphomicrobium sp.]HRN89209.1 transketolase C-terminal domain-containing protein [Hyphomicrobium sp.]HRQ26115.1 transketolase C-terminal domain-containing protein [Hyphomicrobium sp.]
MRQQILMPPMTPTMTDGRIARWHVSEGQHVAAGDVLVEIATSTATLELEASSEGRVERILVPAGTEGVKVNTPIAIVFAGVSRPLEDAPSAALGFASLGALPPDEAGRSPAQGRDHGLAPARGTTYREALRDALAEEMHADDSVFLIGTDVAQNRGAPKVAQGLLDTFGEKRVVKVAALEDALFGVALGAAMAGLKPVVEIAHWGRALEVLTPYLATAAEAFYLSGGAQAVPLVIRGPNGYVPGMAGQDARCVAADLARIPGLKVAHPATAASAKALLRAAIQHPGPVAVLEHELLYAIPDATVDDPFDPAPGKARIVRSGTDVTIAAAGRAVLTALEAANELSLDGIEAEIVDLMWVRPLDRETVSASVSRTGRLVTVEDGAGEGGIGAELIAHVAANQFRALRSPPRRIAGASVPMPYAAELQAVAVPRAQDVAHAVKGLVHQG